MDDEWLMQEDEEGDEPFCNCCTSHSIEETDWNQCDCCGKPIYDEDPETHNAALRGDSGFIAGVPLESTVMQRED